jgi:homopolymeric O-antigen transport system ATP-binding protein
MSDTVIRVEGLGKKYTIGRERNGSDGLRHKLNDFVSAPFRRFRRLSSDVRPLTSDFWALKDVSFEVKQGEVVGIIGRNGAGKSTLLKILSRITEPTEGRVRIRGRVASLLEVGTGFHPELTGRENVFLNGAILGMSREEIKRKFDEIVAFAEVEKFLDTPVKRYSSGMYVRLAFAVAAHLEPEILIVDEVLAVGDAQFQKKCLGKMGDVAGHGRTVLFVSHNMAAIADLCNRTILLRKGVIAIKGNTQRVISDYLGEARLGRSGQYDLRDHPLRAAGARPLIEAIHIRSSSGGSASELYPDEEFCIEIHCNCLERIDTPRVAVAVEDYLGRRIMTMASYFESEPLPALEGRVVLRCTSPPLQLGPGRYLLSASIGTRKDGLIDSVDGAALFEIAWRKNFESGEPFSSVYGPVLRKSSWRIAT